MPNYLQRIANSGARTSSVVKPAAAARGLMPPIGPLLSPAMPEETSAAVAEPPAPPIPARPATLAVAEPGRETVSPRETLVEEKSVRTTPPPVAIPPRIANENPASRFSVRAPEALRASAIPSVRDWTIQKVAEETIQIFGPRTTMTTAAKQESAPPPKETSAMPARQQQQPLLETSGQRLVPEASQQARPPALRPTEDASTPIPTPKFASEFRAETSPSLAPAADVHGVESSPAAVRAATSPRPSVITKEPGIDKPATDERQLHVRPANAPEYLRHAPAAEARHRTQVSIGRIDVQVDNQAPLPPATPQPARVPARMNSLEQRYLGRFFLSF